MKKVRLNNKGFIMTEALIISAVVLTALILIYAQFIKINRAYTNDYLFNDVDGMYKLSQIATYLDDENYTDGLSISNGYIDITDCSFATNESYCKILFDAADIKYLLVTFSDKTILASELTNNNPYDSRFMLFARNIDDSDISYGYTLVAEFKNGTYASLPYGYGIMTRCAYEPGHSWDFAYTGNVQTFDVPCDGLYKLEVWGAKGGVCGGGSVGGAGGYASGYAFINHAKDIYVVAGGTGGYNGGGSGCGTGGGATHIGLSNNLLKNTAVEDLYIVAGGGGAGSDGTFTWWDDAKNKMRTDVSTLTGGSGGGLNGGNGASNTGNGCYYGYGATQTAGGRGGNGRTNLDGSYGQGGNGGGNGGGGGGFYGGGAGTGCNTSSAGGGGSGYVGGVPEITYKGTIYTPSTSNGGNGSNGKAKITLVTY